MSTVAYFRRALLMSLQDQVTALEKLYLLGLSYIPCLFKIPKFYLSLILCKAR